MRIDGIGVNVADIADMMPAIWDVQANEDTVGQPLNDLFGPAYEVKISEEGRKIFEEQAAEVEAGVWGVRDGGGIKVLLGRETKVPGEAEGFKAAEEGIKPPSYEDQLEEILTQIKTMNAAYGPIIELDDDDPLKKSIAQKRQKEALEQQRLLQERTQEQKDFQTEEGLKRQRVARKLAAMKDSRYKGEIDENNRDLVTLLRTMEEQRKAEEEREEGVSKEESGGTSGTENETSDTIRNSAMNFMKASFDREKDVEELSDMVGDFGREFLSQADDIAQKLLRKGRDIGAVIKDGSATNEQIEEMLESFRGEVQVALEEAYFLGSFGTQLARDRCDVKLQRLANDPLQAMQATREGMMQAASDAALGEAGMSGVDKTSKELAEEVQELIDRRDHIDRTSQEEKEEEDTGELSQKMQTYLGAQKNL